MPDWPNESDRRSWEALRQRNPKLPPYDEAGDELQRLWYGVERLTTAQIAAAYEAILHRIKTE